MAGIRGRERTANSAGPAIDASAAGSCPQCHQPVVPDADLCEHCQAWLKPGCVFCGAATRPGDELCPACGEPWSGIVCGACGTYSRFDCCPDCGGALTARAEVLVGELLADPRVEGLLRNAEAAIAEPGPAPAEDRHATARAARAALLRDLEVHPGAPAAAKATPRPGAGADDLLAGGGVVRARVRVQPDRKEAEAKLAASLAELSARSFDSAQEARAYFDAIRLVIRISVPRTVVVGWRCHAYGVTHSDGPSGCAAPHQGGTWITVQSGVEIREREVELG